MKLTPRNWRFRDEGDLIAGFGEANLFKYLNGKFELRGGTDTDRAEAKQWCSQFMLGAAAACSPATPASYPRISPCSLRVTRTTSAHRGR